MESTSYLGSVRQLHESCRDMVLPAYQRGIVWTPEQALALVESVYEGYPIGTLLVWDRSWDVPGGQVYLLDGQQRAASLTGFRCGTDEPGPQVGWSAAAARWTTGPVDEDDRWITLREWHGMRITEWKWLEDQCGVEAFETAVRALEDIRGATVHTVVLRRASPEQAVETFRRLNSTGTPINHDELARLLAMEGM